MRVSGKARSLAKDREGAVFGPIFSARRYFIHNCSLRNTVRGIVERVLVLVKDGVYTLPPRPSSGSFFHTLGPEARRLTAGLKLRPLTLRDTVSLWKGSKLKVYQRAYESLVVNKLSRSDGFLKAFVKCEKIDASKGDPAPRIIQPRSPRYNLHLARYIKCHESEFYRRIDAMFDTDGTGDRTVFKGLNARETAKHLLLKAGKYSHPVFVGLDASRFDQHVSVEALQWEHSVYLDCFAYGQRELSTLLEWQIDNIGRAYLPDGTIKYRVEGRRASGDMNTSLGNCMIMCSLVRAYMRHAKIGKFSLANNGDDCVLIFERDQLHKISDLTQWFHGMGFNMKQEAPVYDLRQVSFCQVNVLTSPDYNICVRNPDVAMSKDLHSCHPFTHHHQYSQWLAASGLCGSTSHGGIPILEAFYDAFPKVDITDRGISEEYERWMQYSIVGGGRDVPISDEMRHSFWVAFNIVPDAQIALEEELAKVKFGDREGNIIGTPYTSIFQGNI